MEVHFKPELEAKVNQLAAENSSDAEDIRFCEAVRRGFDSIDRGDFIEEEEMDARVDQMLHP